MTTNASFKSLAAIRGFISFVAGALCFCILLANAYGAPTALGTQPFVSSSKINALPNVMYILDDSGSMSENYLPDWAGPYQATISGVLTVVTPPHMFFNGAYNGVAYNSATRYRPPVMYTSTGTLDTTTYPSQTGDSAATGGSAMASAAAPNWQAVKVDGYGIQSTATANLEGNAFSYSTVPGEYCDSVQLRNCVVSAAPTGVYTFPASLRWCTTSVLSVDTTANAGTSCQASNIADTPTNAANGVTAYTFPRMPRPHTATITVNAGGTVTGIAVGGQQILSADAVGLTSTDVATAIVLQINACTYGIPALTPSSRCTVVGYSAVADPNIPNEITVTAPAPTAATPAVTGVAATSVAFSNGSVPGSSVLTVITPTVGSYFKGPNRSDCAGASCTYAEEMTNYANWYAYYQTRMQMMKTAASIAFSAVGNNFRVGFYSINNGGGAGNFFINPDTFDGTQKNLWYSTFFNATPFGATPLRNALATIGRMYAGQLNGSQLNGVSVNEPLQYSCQQNFTIMSTDGYWNDTDNPKQIDGTTDIGEQDAGLDRPYYDGGAQNKTVSQTTKTDNQTGINSFVVTSMTQQQQSTTSRLDQTVVTTDTYPYSTQTSTLQTQTTPLNRTDYALVQSTYPLTSTTKQLQESTYLLNSTPRPLQIYINNLTKTTTPLDQKTYQVTVGTQLLTERDYKVTVGTQLLTKKDYNVTVGTQLLTKKDFKVTVGTQLLTRNVYRLTRTTYALQRSTYMLQTSTRQLQQKNDYSTDGGDTWQNTGWFNVNSCTTRTSGPGWKRNTVCRYDTAVVNGGQNSCTTIAADTTSPYNVRQAVSCAYETVPTVAAVGTCNVAAQSAASPYAPAVTCDYAAAPTVLTGRGTCTAHDETGLPSMSGNKVVCAYDAAATTTTNNLGSCTWVVPSPAASAPRTDCSYQAASFQAGQATCTAALVGTATTDSTVWSTGVSCAYDPAPTTTTTNLPNCTWKVPAVAASAPRTDCSYQVVSNQAGQASCTAAPLGTVTTNNTLWGTGVTCSYDTVPTTTTNLPNCTWKVPAPAASAPRTDCSYQVVSNQAGQATCTAAPVGTLTTDTTVWNTGVTCSYDTVPTTTTNLPSCTWAVPAVAASAPKTDCSYQVASNSAGQATCTAVPVGTVTANNTIWGTAVSCSYDAVPTTTSNVATCTWVVPSPAASAPRTDCVYNAAAAGTATVGSCTTVAASTGNANGTVWQGPIVSCVYQAASLQSTNQTTCTAGTPSVGPVFSSYTTCAYVNGVTTTGLNSCTYVPDSTGPVYTGPANACAYAAVPNVVNVASCTPVAQSPTFAAPQKTCTYEAVGTPASNLATCTDAPQSVSAPYSGPNVRCSYSAVATVTNPASCTVNVEAGPSYLNGAAVSCGYAAGVSTNNVAACSVQAKKVGLANGTVYAPATDCAYGSPTALVNATAACVPVAQSTTSPYAGPARNCQYTAWSPSTYAGTCTAVPQDNTNLTARSCSSTPVPVPISTVTTTVDLCLTTPTSGVSPVDPAATRSTTTACAYRAATTTNVATCTPHAADSTSPYATAVSCPISNPGMAYVNVASCTPAGSLPATFDATGKLVDCKTTDTTPYTAAYPSGPVPVASCIPGTNPSTFVQTSCTTMLSTGPTPVDPATCTTVNPGVAPDYVSTVCTTTSTASTAIGCPNGVTPPTAPLWQTVSCSPVANSGPPNTLADVAAYYYYTDLRTMALNNCTGAVVPPATTGSDLCSAANPDPTNNVPTTPNDPLSTQHMTTFTLGLGASGYMKYSGTYLTDSGGDYATVYGVPPHRAVDGIAANPATGVCSWQASGNCNWPYPTSDQQTAIDDLWHAGVNGHGAYFSATDPNSLSASLSTALASVAAAGGAAAAAAISNPNLTPGDNYVFSSSYTTVDWTGELVRQQLDPYTGAVSPNIDWAVQAKLDANASRNIYTFNGSTATKLIAFTSANFAANVNFLMPHISTSPTGLTQFLCAFASTCLSATDQDASHASGANLVNFLRGDRSNEGVVNDNTKYYRQRAHLLGDMVDAETVYVNQPVYNYADPGYSAFVAAQAARQAVVYAGANDGMLHAFAAKGRAATEAAVAAAAAANSAASLDPTNAALASAAAAANAAAAAAMAADTLIGQELWAYIPSMVIPNLYLLADKDYKDRHQYYVDATPVVGDICASGCGAAGTAVWKTILVGGLGHGGRGYYALDITDPANPKALWEFTDANLGYSYGNPQIAKMSDGTWVVLVTSGYNNIPNPDGAGGDGVGRLFVLDAGSGAQIASVSPISTGFGSTTSPSGLAKITAQVVNPNSDNTVEAVYGGDLYGNLWRFDINNTVGATGYDAQLLAILKDGSGNVQSITTKPEVALIPAASVKVVYVGTGRLLDSTDISDTSPQSFYAIKDVRATGTTPATAIFDNPGGLGTMPRPGGLNTNGFVGQVQTEILCPAAAAALFICELGTPVRTSTDFPVDFSTGNGWFIDLIGASERDNTDPALGLGLLAFNTNAPSLAACDVGGTSYQYFLDYLTGGPIHAPGNYDPVLDIGYASRFVDNALSSDVKLAMTKDGKFITYTQKSSRNIDIGRPPLPAPASITQRTSWRELIVE